MGDTDWSVWPIFVAQGIVFLLFFLKSRLRFLKIPIQGWVVIFILAINISIVVSLAHDSTSLLHLHF